MFKTLRKILRFSPEAPFKTSGLQGNFHSSSQAGFFLPTLIAAIVVIGAVSLALLNSTSSSLRSANRAQALNQDIAKIEQAKTLIETNANVHEVVFDPGTPLDPDDDETWFIAQHNPDIFDGSVAGMPEECLAIRTSPGGSQVIRASNNFPICAIPLVFDIAGTDADCGGPQAGYDLFCNAPTPFTLPQSAAENYESDGKLRPTLTLLLPNDAGGYHPNLSQLLTDMRNDTAVDIEQGLQGDVQYVMVTSSESYQVESSATKLELQSIAGACAGNDQKLLYDTTLQQFACTEESDPDFVDAMERIAIVNPGGTGLGTFTPLAQQLNVRRSQGGDPYPYDFVLEDDPFAVAIQDITSDCTGSNTLDWVGNRFTCGPDDGGGAGGGDLFAGPGDVPGSDQYSVLSADTPAAGEFTARSIIGGTNVDLDFDSAQNTITINSTGGGGGPGFEIGGDSDRGDGTLPPGFFLFLNDTVSPARLWMDIDQIIQSRTERTLPLIAGQARFQTCKDPGVGPGPARRKVAWDETTQQFICQQDFGGLERFTITGSGQGLIDDSFVSGSPSLPIKSLVDGDGIEVATQGPSGGEEIQISISSDMLVAICELIDRSAGGPAISKPGACP